MTFMTVRFAGKGTFGSHEVAEISLAPGTLRNETRSFVVSKAARLISEKELSLI